MFDKNGLYDIYGIWHQPFWQTTWFKYSCVSMLGLILLLISILIGYWLYTWMRQKKYTAGEIAIMKLEQLKNKSYATPDDAKQAYAVITSVLKQYFTQRYGWPVSAATDEELAVYVQSSPLSDELTQQIKTILSGAVLIKFANQAALEPQVKADIDRALHIVHVTTPQPKKS